MGVSKISLTPKYFRVAQGCDAKRATLGPDRKVPYPNGVIADRQRVGNNAFSVGDESRRSFFPEWGSTAGGTTDLKLHLLGNHPRVANDRAVTAKERSRHKDAGNNGPNERWPIEPRLSHVPISDRDRSLAVTALSLAVATITADLTKVSFPNGASATSNKRAHA